MPISTGQIYAIDGEPYVLEYMATDEGILRHQLGGDTIYVEYESLQALTPIGVSVKHIPIGSIVFHHGKKGHLMGWEGNKCLVRALNNKEVEWVLFGEIEL
jgi:hypothetical protein